MSSRTLVSKLSPFFSAARSSSINRLRPLATAGDLLLRRSISGGDGFRSFSSRPTTSSLNDPSPNWSSRPPKETILLDGCDFEHWLVVVEPPDPNLTRDEIIDSYIKTLAQVVGSEEEARMSIYSVSTKHYFAFGAKVSEELSYKIKELPKVRWVLPDSYLDVKKKDYGGEPFINGQAVPYDPKYHEEWVRNNARANERSRRNDRPRNFDRSRNFERRREAAVHNASPPMQNQGYQGAPTSPAQNAPPPMPNRDFNQPPPQNAAPPIMPNRDFNQPPQQNASPPPPQPPPNAGYQNQMPFPSYQGQGASNPPLQNASSPPMPNRDFHQLPPQNAAPPIPNRDFHQPPSQNASPPPPPPPPNVGYQNQIPNPNYQRQGGGPPPYQGPGGYQGGPPAYQGGRNNPPYQGGNPGYQGGGPPTYQGGNPNYLGGGGHQGGVPPYQGGSNYQPVNDAGYQNYQAGSPNPASPSQPGASGYEGSNSSYQGGGSAYQGRDLPGRD